MMGGMGEMGEMGGMGEMARCRRVVIPAQAGIHEGSPVVKCHT